MPKSAAAVGASGHIAASRAALQSLAATPPYRCALDDIPLRVALINNMPDAALARTEQQFTDLLYAAAGGRPVELLVCGLSTVERGAVGQAYLEGHSVPLATLWRSPPAAIVVTGAEPKHHDLRDESYWGSLVELLDQAEAHAAPCLLSCLAAHAAVQHIGHVPRHPLPDKCFGVFDHTITATHGLAHGAGGRMSLPHSRWNSVAENALVDAGYQVVSHSRDAGVGFFTKRRRSLWLFCQGHPEYDDANLLREYRRDVQRFLAGERPAYPNLPRSYFCAADEETLNVFRSRALVQRDKALMVGFPTVAIPRTAENEHRAAVRVVANWLTDAAQTWDQRERAAATLSGW